ncbi:MAG: D-TA family PLP-dependent enzyme, partial [Armatimonadetes bacterium]|nr:D-TA family PLP-dependent enzyme [Armatimonadota bacterium]
MTVEELDTPVLTVNLDALEANLDRYQQYYRTHGIGLRPHIKTHKTLAIAHMQMARGAIGLTCQKLGEAEVMAWGGLGQDLLVPYNILGRQKLDRMVALAGQARLTVAADSETTVAGLAEAVRGAGVTVGVLVDVDLGGGRTGVQSPEEAVRLGARIAEAPGLEMRGIMAFPTPPSVRPGIVATLEALDRAGLPHPIVSGGSTKSALEAHEIPELTEYRAGEYPVGGVGHLREGRHTVAQCALRVIATVVSRPNADRAILDCGSKTLSATLV